MKFRAAPLVLMLGVLLPCQAADTATLADPTRPPVGVLRSILPPGPGGLPPSPGPQAATGASSGASSARVPKALPLGPRLTLIRVGRTPAQTVALIDGHAVSVGDRLGDWTVLAIDTRGVTLRGARGTQRLALLPAMDQGAALATPAASGSEKESP